MSTQLAREVLNSVNLEFSHVEHLAAQISPHDPKSVRVTFIHFILSFIIEGNSYIIRQLLQNKGKQWFAVAVHLCLFICTFLIKFGFSSIDR